MMGVGVGVVVGAVVGEAVGLRPDVLAVVGADAARDLGVAGVLVEVDDVAGIVRILVRQVDDVPGVGDRSTCREPWCGRRSRCGARRARRSGPTCRRCRSSRRAGPGPGSMPAQGRRSPRKENARIVRNEETPVCSLVEGKKENCEASLGSDRGEARRLRRARGVGSNPVEARIAPGRPRTRPAVNRQETLKLQGLLTGPVETRGVGQPSVLGPENAEFQL